MKVPKQALADCLQIDISEVHQSEIDIYCGFNCPHCGFDRAVNKKRLQRIQNNEWSYRLDPKGREIAFLDVSEEW